MGCRRLGAAVLFGLVLALALADQGLGQEREGEYIPTPSASPAPSGIPNAPPLTLGQIEQIALQSNPTLVQAGADVQAAEGRAVQARLLPNPKILYLGFQMGALETAGQQAVMVDQTLVTGKKLALSSAAGREEVNSARWSASEQQCRVLNTVRIRYYRALAAVRLIRLRQMQLSSAEEMVRTGAALLRKQKIEESDLEVGRLEVERARTTLEDAQVRYSGAWRQLMIYVGQPEMEPAALEDILDQPRGRFEFADALSRVLGNSPQLHRVRNDVARYELLLRRARAEAIPNVDLQGGPQYDFTTENTEANVQVTVGLPLFDRNQGGIREAEANLTRARAEVRRSELAIRQRFSVSFRHYVSASNDVWRYQETLLPQASRVFKMRLKGVREGKGQWSDLIDAYRTLNDLEQNYVQRLQAARESEVELGGLMLLGGLDQPDGPPSDNPDVDNGG